jgi:bacteriorhodopsin
MVGVGSVSTGSPLLPLALLSLSIVADDSLLLLIFFCRLEHFAIAAVVAALLEYGDHRY